jgi:hypothetical protein
VAAVHEPRAEHLADAAGGAGDEHPHGQTLGTIAPSSSPIREAGMEVLGISLVTNLAAGITGEPLNHEEVLAAGRAAASRMGDLLGAVVSKV